MATKPSKTDDATLVFSTSLTTYKKVLKVGKAHTKASPGLKALVARVRASHKAV